MIEPTHSLHDGPSPGLLCMCTALVLRFLKALVQLPCMVSTLHIWARMFKHVRHMQHGTQLPQLEFVLLHVGR